MMKRIAETILAVMVVGLIGNGLVMWKDQGVQDEKIAQNIGAIHGLKEEDKEQQKMIQQIHWHLIQSKGIEVPKELK